MRRVAWGAVPLLLLALARDADAQHAPAGPRVFFPPPRVLVFTALTYERKPGAEVCPGEKTLHSELGRRMGHDPFVPSPEGISVGDIRVVVTKVPGGFDARYEWTGSNDAQQPTNRFEEPGHTRRDCYDVLVDVAIELAAYFAILEIEYGRKLAPKKSPPACPSTELATPAPCIESRFSVWPDEMPMAPLPKPKPDPSERPERWPLAIRVGAAVWPELVASGWGSLGVSVEVGARYRSVSAGIEAHGDPPLGSQSFQNLGEVTFARLSGALLLCAHFGWFTGCGIGDAGRIFFPNRIHYLPASVFYGAAGVRAGFEFPLVPSRLFLRVAVDLRAPIRPARYAPAGHEIFRAAGPGAGLGIGLLAEFPP